MQKKNYSSLVYYLLSLSFLLIALLGSVHFWSFNRSFYESEHSKIMLYGKHINEHIGISNEDLTYLTDFTLDYLNDPKASLDLQLEVNGQLREIYTNDEKLHMIDVRNLNLAANYILIGSIVVFIVCLFIIYKKFSFNEIWFKYKNFIKVVGLFFAVLIVWILIDFDSFWTFFHHIFFPSNELWLLDLRKDILIMIVPPEFFNDLVTTIVATFVIAMLLFTFVLYKLSRKNITND